MSRGARTLPHPQQFVTVEVGAVVGPQAADCSPCSAVSGTQTGPPALTDGQRSAITCTIRRACRTSRSWNARTGKAQYQITHRSCHTAIRICPNEVHPPILPCTVNFDGNRTIILRTWHIPCWCEPFKFSLRSTERLTGRLGSWMRAAVWKTGQRHFRFYRAPATPSLMEGHVERRANGCRRMRHNGGNIRDEKNRCSSKNIPEHLR